MQNVKSAGDARMSKCYQNVRETLLMAKNKTDMMDALKEMKMSKFLLLTVRFVLLKNKNFIYFGDNFTK